MTTVFSKYYQYKCHDLPSKTINRGTGGRQMSAGLFKKTSMALAIAAVAALSGCNSSSSLNTSGGLDTSNIEDRLAEAGIDVNQLAEQFATVQGVAAKGIIQKGIVEAVEVDANGNDLQIVGKAKTDDAGRYEIKILGNYQGGPIVFRIKADQDTRMICDVHVSGACEYGKPTTLDPNFVLEAIVPKVQKAAKVKAQITPLTAMAVARVRAAGLGVNEQAIRDANSALSEMVGADILDIEPIDITKDADPQSSEEQKLYAAFVAGVGRVAFEDPEGLAKGLKKVAKSYEDGDLDEEEEGGMTLSKVLAAVEDEGIKGKTKVAEVAHRAEIIRSLSNNGRFIPKPAPAEDARNKVDIAKELVSDVRTWMGSLAGLQDPVAKFGVNLEAVGSVLDQNAATLTTLYATTLEQVVTALDGKPVQELPGTHYVPIQAADGSALGTVIVEVATQEGLRFHISEDPNSPIGEADLSLQVTSNIIPDNDSLSLFRLNQPELTVTGSVENGATKIALQDLKVAFEFEQPVTLDVNAADGPEPPQISAAELEGKVEIRNKVNAAGFNGELDTKFVKPYATALPESGMRPNDAPLLFPTKLAFQGAVADGSGNRLAGAFELKSEDAEKLWDDKETRDSYAKLVVEARLTLQLSKLPEAKAVLTLKREGVDAGEARLTLLHDGNLLSVNAEGDKDSGHLQAVFKNNKGAKLKIESVDTDSGTKVDGELFVHGEKVATVSDVKGRGAIVRYTDGTDTGYFESLF